MPVNSLHISLLMALAAQDRQHGAMRQTADGPGAGVRCGGPGRDDAGPGVST